MRIKYKKKSNLNRYLFSFYNSDKLFIMNMKHSKAKQFIKWYTGSSKFPPRTLNKVYLNLIKKSKQ